VQLVSVSQFLATASSSGKQLPVSYQTIKPSSIHQQE